jgi:hypothetical protein
VAPKRYCRPRALRRTGLALAVTAALSIGTVGCSDDDETYGLQPLPSGTPSVPSRTGPVLTAEQQAVADAVTRYDAVIKAMSDGAPLDMRKIRTVAVDPWATKAGRNLMILKAQKYRTFGRLSSSTTGISVSASRATFIECSDSRGQRVVTNDSKHKIVTEGAAPRVATSVLVKINDRWFVRDVREGKAC